MGKQELFSSTEKKQYWILDLAPATMSVCVCVCVLSAVLSLFRGTRKEAKAGRELHPFPLHGVTLSPLSFPLRPSS